MVALDPARLLAEATPGPWRACVWDPMERPHVHADQPGELVCRAARDLPISAADARLIAAAPDLARLAIERGARIAELEAAARRVFALTDEEQDAAFDALLAALGEER